MFRSEDHRAFAAASESGVAGAADQGAAETWARVKRRLRAELGEDIFSRWFGRLELDSVVDRCAYLTVPTRFLKSWIESHYTDRVLALYRAESTHLDRVVIAVRNGVCRDPSALRRPTEVSRLSAGPVLAGVPSAGEPTPMSTSVPDARSDGNELGGAPLDTRLTFDSFIVGRSNALAHAAAELWR